MNTAPRWLAACLALLLLAPASHAGSTRVSDGSGRTLVRVGDDGSIRQASGSLAGRLGDGVLRKPGGSRSLVIDAQGAVRNPAGRLLGRIQQQGSRTVVRDAGGRLLGQVTPDGSVRDASGRRLGQGDGTAPATLALLFFFWPDGPLR